jgi:hypothetical protein
VPSCPMACRARLRGHSWSGASADDDCLGALLRTSRRSATLSARLSPSLAHIDWAVPASAMRKSRQLAALKFRLSGRAAWRAQRVEDCGLGWLSGSQCMAQCPRCQCRGLPRVLEPMAKVAPFSCERARGPRSRRRPGGKHGEGCQPGAKPYGLVHGEIEPRLYFAYFAGMRPLQRHNVRFAAASRSNEGRCPLQLCYTLRSRCTWSHC